MDAIWERWDLVCDPAGCEPLDQTLRIMIYGFVLIGLMIFYAAVRPWTQNLPTPVGVAVSALASLIITRLCVDVVTSSPRLVAALVALGLVAVWIGRPAFTERSPRPATAELNEEASPTSSTH